VQDSSIATSSNTTVCFSPKNGYIYNENEVWRLDKCTECTCRNGIVLCEMNECPPVACQNPVYEADECCPHCPREDENKFQKSPFPQKYWSCFDSHEQNRPHGTSWKENDCYHCTCMNGENKCFHYENKCPKLNCARPILNKGQCCSMCIDGANSPYILSNELITNVSSFTPNSKPLYVTFFLNCEHVNY